MVENKINLKENIVAFFGVVVVVEREEKERDTVLIRVVQLTAN